MIGVSLEADLVVALTLGDDCLAGVAALRAEPELFDPVASDPVGVLARESVSAVQAAICPGIQA